MSITLDELLKSRGDHCTIETDALTFAQLSETLERARVVGVLDAWVSATRAREECGGVYFASWEIIHNSRGELACELVYEEWSGEEDGRWVECRKTFEGPNNDAARAAAAKAIEAEEV
jgi:hypothetical protein